MPTITRDQVLHAARIAVARTPHAMNPMSAMHNTCMNWSEQNHTERCIASQVLSDLGIELREHYPRGQCGSIGMMVNQLESLRIANFMEEAIALLVDLQYDFDKATQQGLNWSQAARQVPPEIFPQYAPC